MNHFPVGFGFSWLLFLAKTLVKSGGWDYPMTLVSVGVGETLSSRMVMERLAKDDEDIADLDVRVVELYCKSVNYPTLLRSV
jgi:hypothetical protein